MERARSISGPADFRLNVYGGLFWLDRGFKIGRTRYQELENIEKG
jgi:hypothetical protein